MTHPDLAIGKIRTDGTEVAALDFTDPRSVVRIAPATGAFATNEFVDDRAGFVSRIVGRWYNVPGNTLTVEPDTHKEQAEKLFDLYAAIQRKPSKLNNTQLSLILMTLNKTGSIEKGFKILDAALAVE